MKNFYLLVLTTLFCLNVQAQSFYDMSTIQEIKITFAQSNWDQLLDAQKNGAEDYTMAQTVEINGTVFDSVGVKYKGNSTYNANQTKNPFHIELDTYKEQDYQGFKDIKLSNVAKDPSFLREVLSYQIIRQYMVAPQSNYANVYVNGTLIGLYSNSEAVSKTFMSTYFDSKKDVFVKCNPPAGAGPQSNDLPDLVYRGTDSTNYYDGYELKSDDGWYKLIDLCDSLGNYTASIDQMLDVDRALWMLALDNVLVNLDSYIGSFQQNYYLYRDDFDRFISVIWDLNESFGRFTNTGSGNLNSNAQKQQMSHLLHSTDPDFPLISDLLGNPLYKRMYLAHFKTILLENFSNNNYYTQGLALQNTIEAAVLADPNKFFTYANFTANLTTDVAGGPGPGGGGTIGITNLMNARSSYLLGLSDFTQTEPTITNVNPSNTSPNLNALITINADVQNATQVYLGYRYITGAPFTRILMYDDGAHNDGAANDGTYGVNVNMSNIFLQYYIYGDNANIGKFSPVRAEYEYHEVQALSPAAGNLVINEVLTSNTSTIADQNNEFDDWIELHNNSASAINLGGYFLSDNIDKLMKWTIPAGTIINPSGYVVVWADEDSSQGPLHCNFKLSSVVETVFLSDPNGNLIDYITFSNQTSDISYGRYVNGTGSFQALSPTFGAENMLPVSTTDFTKEEIKMFAVPNPAHESFRVRILENNAPVRNVKVIDIFGHTIIDQEMKNEILINTSAWAKGMYIIRVENSSIKVLVQ